MPFGKYQDRQLTEIPRQYLRWLRTRPWLGAWLAQEIDAVLDDSAEATTGVPCGQAPKGRTPGVDDATLGPFSVLPSGNGGQVVLGPDGETVAWTTDPWVAQVIARLLCDNEHLLRVRCEPTMHHFV
jgi:hypothetical protein